MASSGVPQTGAIPVSAPVVSHWEEHRELFHELYNTRSLPLEKVKEIAEEVHQLPRAPLSSYETKLRDELGLRKNLKGEDWAVIGRLVASRPQANVYHHGKIIPRDKLKRTIRRYSKVKIRVSSRLPPNVSIIDPSDSGIGNEIALFRQDFTTASDQPNMIQHVASPGPHAAPERPPPAPLSVALPSSALVPASQCQGLIRGTVALLASENNAVDFIRLSAPILDDRFAKLWEPLLDRIPTRVFLRVVRERLTHYNDRISHMQPFARGSQWGLMSLRTLEAVELTDAQDLGLLSPSGSAPAFTPSTEPRSSHHFASHLSTFKDPFHALGIILHRLSNNVAVDDISELMDQFAQQIPEPLFMAVLQLDCPTVRASWTGLLRWMTRIDNSRLFVSLAETMLHHHSPCSREDYGMVLVLAAIHNCPGICERAIECGGDPDQHVNLRGRQGELSGTSPLIYAAINGNTDTVKMLLECGADVNFRVDGFTAAGHLLVVLKKDTQHREHRTEVLRLLLDRGSDINALFRRDNLYYSSEATLLDEAILGDDADVTEIFREFSSASTTGRPTVSLSGIITCAKESTEKLRNYILKLPPGKKWERMQVAALTWCLDRTNVQATLAMTEVGFTLTRLFTKEPGFFWQGWQPGPILDFFTSVYRDSPLTTLSERLARVILEEPQDTDVRNALIKSCLGSSHPEVLRLLFRVLAQLRGNGAEMMAIAARFGSFQAVSLLHQEYQVEYGGFAEFRGAHFSVLLLSAASFYGHFGQSPLLAESQPASVEMLDFLVRQGADVNTCHPSLWSRQHRIAGEQLKWAFDRGLEHGGISVYRVMFQCMQVWNSGGPQSDSEQPSERELLRSLADMQIPIFSAHEAESFRHSQNFETDIHPLSFFISRSPGPDFIDQVLASGIDINGTGKRLETDTPLRAAIRVRDQRSAEKLVSLGAQVKGPEHDCGLSTIQLACGARMDPTERSITSGPADLKLVELLLNNGADVNATGRYCCFPALQLVRDVQAVELLLDHEADPNELVARCEDCNALDPHGLDNGDNVTMIQYTIRRIEMFGAPREAKGMDLFLGIIDLLLQGGARINERATLPSCGKRKLGYSALEMAAGLPDETLAFELVGWLLERGAELEPPAGYRGSCALSIACGSGNLDLVKLLLDRGMDPNRKDKDGAVPLTDAAARGDMAIVLLLLGAGANVCADTALDRSPLVMAAQNGRLDVVALLLEYETRDHIFEEAIWDSKHWNHTEVASFIQQRLEQLRAGRMGDNGDTGYVQFRHERPGEARRGWRSRSWNLEDSQHQLRPF